VEVKPDMILEGIGGGDGKKVRKERKEDRLKRVEKRLNAIEARLMRERELTGMNSYSQLPQAGSSMEVQLQTQTQQAFKMEQDVKPVGTSFKREEDIKSAAASFSQANGAQVEVSFEQEYDTKSASSSFKQELDIKATGPSLSESHALPGSVPPSYSQDDEMKWEMSISSLGLPPPNVREQATTLLQEEICERSTKIKALITRLIPFSLANPHSANYNPAGLDVQIVESDGNASADNVIKTVVLYVALPFAS
jgi:hypothetical protein